MINKMLFLFCLIAYISISVLKAQENKIVILNLKNGYSAKGEIVEKSDKAIKLRILNGEIIEYKTDEISNVSNAKSTTSSKVRSKVREEYPKLLFKGEKIINIGVGFGGGYFLGGDKIIIPPIPISFEYIVKDDLFNGKGAIGCGGFLGYSASKNRYSQDNETKYFRLIIGAKGYLHYHFAKKLDTYAGVLIGYKERTDEVNPAHIAFRLPIGCRYFFNNKYAGLAELGGGMSIITIGVALKL
jgi:hypothetical protein